MQREEDDVGDRRRHDLRKAIDPFETEKNPLSDYGGCRDRRPTPEELQLTNPKIQSDFSHLCHV
jgi:hypothetical protein